MLRRPDRQLAVTMIVMFLSCCGLLLLLSAGSETRAEAASASVSSSAIRSSSLSAIPSPSPTSGTQQSSPNFLDPAIIAALIALLGGIPGWLISRIFTKRAERKTLEVEEQREKEQKTHQRELLELQLQHQREIETEKLRIASEIRTQEEQLKRQDREEQFRREMMEHAQSIEQRVLVYRAAFSADPHIAHLQILGMTRPLKIKDIFVPMRVRLDERSQEKLDLALQEAEELHDPLFLMDTQQRMRQRRSDDAIEPTQAIRQYPRCVILGDPGAGKTTLLKYLALLAIAGELTGLPDLPVYIELNKFVGSTHHDLLEFVASQWEQEYNFPHEDALHYITARLNDGEAILFLDALDETLIGATTEEAEASYKSVLDTIITTAKRYHKSQIVVTARKAGYRQQKALSGFHQLEIQEFRPEDITAFVNNWFRVERKVQERIRVADLHKRLADNARLHALASNPLLLSLIVIIYENHHTLPDDRAELYKRCADMLLFEWSTRHDIPLHSELSKSDKLQLLSEIAWHFHIRRKHYFVENELLEVISTFLLTFNKTTEKSHAILNEITNIHGLLKPQAWQLYGFLHVSFQEYFAAEYAREHYLLDDLLKHVGDPSWEEVILLYASLVPDATPLLQKLLEPQQQEDIFSTNLLLAGRCLADHTRIQQHSLRKEIASRLFETLLSTPYVLMQEHIISILAAIDDEAITTRLLQMLADENRDHSVRLQIAEAFRMVGKPSLAQELLSLLSKKEIDAGVRESIAEALSRSGNQQVAYQLLRLLDTFRDESGVYHAMVLTAGILGDAYIVQLLLARLAATINVSQRCSLVEALARTGDETMIGKLLEMLTDQGINLRVRCCIADALAVLGKQSTVALLDLLSQETLEKDIRFHIATILGQSGEQVLVPRLKEVYRNLSLTSQVRASISIVLGMLGEREVIEDLLSILRGTGIDYSLLKHIPAVLVSLGGRSIQSQLLAMLPNTNIDRSVRRSIANALGKLNGLSICHDLFDLLRQERIDAGVRQQIALTLGKLNECSMASSLVDLLATRNINQYVRMSIAEAIALLGEHAVVPRLLPLLTDSNLEAQVRQSIAKTVGVLSRDQFTIDLLSTCIANTDISEDIFRALWSASRRQGVKVFSNQIKISP